MAFLVASSTYYGLEKVDAVPRDHSVYRFIAARWESLPRLKNALMYVAS